MVCTSHRLHDRVTRGREQALTRRHVIERTHFQLDSKTIRNAIVKSVGQQSEKMADPLYELLIPHFDALDTPSRPLLTDHVTSKYLNHLTGLSLAELTTTEPASLSQHSHTLLRSLQALSKRSHKSIISSANHVSNISTSLPRLLQSTKELQDAVPDLDSSASSFAEKYRRGADTENEVLTRRRKALLLANNGERILSILDLPTLLSTAISSASQPGATASAGNYASALDLHAHTKRLGTLYPESPLISSILGQVEQEMKLLITNLITSLQAQNVKLAGAMRTIGWLRRVAPELDESMQFDRQSGKLSMKRYVSSADGALGALFLVCRLTNLIRTLEALEPLRELADQESKDREKANDSKGTSHQDRSGAGQQTERYLKRYIEIFREQSFGIVSMYKSIFPSALPAPGTDSTEDAGVASKSQDSDNHQLLPLPSPLATFPSYLIDMLFDTLKAYLSNVKDRTSRDSLMTQVLYCAGSLGRLGGDFSMMLALLEDEIESDDERDDHEYEWVEVVKKHRIQASKLELLASGVGTGKPLVHRGSSPAVVSPS